MDWTNIEKGSCSLILNKEDITKEIKTEIAKILKDKIIKSEAISDSHDSGNKGVCVRCSTKEEMKMLLFIISKSTEITKDDLEDHWRINGVDTTIRIRYCSNYSNNKSFSVSGLESYFFYITKYKKEIITLRSLLSKYNN